MTIKAMREKIAAAHTVTFVDQLLHKKNVGKVAPITKHQKNALRVDVDGKPFWLSLDRIAVVDENTFQTIGDPKCPYPGEILGTYRIGSNATAVAQ